MLKDFTIPILADFESFSPEELAEVVRQIATALNSLITFSIQRDIKIELQLGHLSLDGKPYQVVVIKKVTKQL